MLGLTAVGPASADAPAAASPPISLRVVLDPGHGGRPEGRSARGGAHFDPYTGRFLNDYRWGVERRMGGQLWSEHQAMLMLARKIRRRLELTASDEGWADFQALVRRVTGVEGDLPRVSLDCLLTRDCSYRDHPERATTKDLNRYFRLFDSPLEYPWTPGGAMYPGRLSKIARAAPDLVVCLHTNGAQSKRLRAQQSLYAPSFEHFEGVRTAILAGKALDLPSDEPVTASWLVHDASRSRVQWMLNDTWTYFTGYGCDATGQTTDPAVDIGVRHDDLQWAYRTVPRPAARRTDLAGPFTGSFWDRERSSMERRRRSGGPEGRGGDNLFAGEELIRFMRHALWKDFLARGQAFGGNVTVEDGMTAGRYLGPHLDPVAADWAVPIFTNAVTAYLEVGYLTNDRDAWLLSSRLDVVADGLAVGIYSLARGAAVRRLPGLRTAPRGRAIDWGAYRSQEGTAWSEQARPVS